MAQTVRINFSLVVVAVFKNLSDTIALVLANISGSESVVILNVLFQGKQQPQRTKPRSEPESNDPRHKP